MTDVLAPQPTPLATQRQSPDEVLRSVITRALSPSSVLPEPLRPFDAPLRSTPWQDLTAESAAGYLAALSPLVQALRRAPPFQRLTNAPVLADTPGVVPARLVGPWECFAFLGRGGHSPVMAARHLATGQPATLKLLADGELLVAAWLDFALPPPFLDVLDWGVAAWGDDLRPWIAREPARETLADHLRQPQGKRLPLADVRSLFRIACDGVAALHAENVYRWSAHARNVFQVGTRWKLGDLGRCVLMTTARDPRLERFLSLGTPLATVDRAAFVDALPAASAAVPDGGLVGSDAYLAQRLIRDDLAMLGGLLVDLLAANRWQVFAQALASECRGRYDLTGQRRRDAALSDILNRCWLGDGGGALALAFGQEKEWEPFADVAELVAAVDGALG